MATARKVEGGKVCAAVRTVQSPFESSSCGQRQPRSQPKLRLLIGRKSLDDGLDPRSVSSSCGCKWVQEGRGRRFVGSSLSVSVSRLFWGVEVALD